MHADLQQLSSAFSVSLNAIWSSGPAPSPQQACTDFLCWLGAGSQSLICGFKVTCYEIPAGGMLFSLQIMQIMYEICCFCEAFENMLYMDKIENFKYL